MTDSKIIKFDESKGSIVIRYSEEFSPMGLDIPINDNKYIVGEELDTFIKGFIPVNHMNRLSLIKSGISNAQEIQSLVEQEPEKVIPVDEERDALELQTALWEEQQFEQNIVAVLKKHNLLSE
jgi:hypothetical protein